MLQCFVPPQSRSIGLQTEACPCLRTRQMRRSGDPSHLEASLALIDDMIAVRCGAVLRALPAPTD